MLSHAVTMQTFSLVIYCWLLYICDYTLNELNYSLRNALTIRNLQIRERCAIGAFGRALETPEEAVGRESS